MTILGTEAIRAALRDGAIVCDPAPARIEGTHIDVTIGGAYWALPDYLDAYELDLAGAEPSEWFILQEAYGRLIVPARGFILAHTQEYIGTAPGSGLLPILHTRSTLARWGLGVHPSAGWGDIGYIGYWTLEIINPHPVAVAIPVGARVGCIAFQRVEGDADSYGRGRYSKTKEEWQPSDMLPRRGNW